MSNQACGPSHLALSKCVPQVLGGLEGSVALGRGVCSPRSPCLLASCPLCRW